MQTKTLIVLALSTCLTGCAAESVTTGTTQLSRELVEKSLINGKTTKSQVQALLGDPQSTVSSSTAGPMSAYMPAETWSYVKTFRRDPVEKGFAYGVAYNMATGRMYDRVEISILTVTFDAKGRVTGHTFTTSAAGAKR